MGTKNNPSKYDCYANAEPDEPMFILLGRDRGASALVDEWANRREENGDDPAIVQEARSCAESMREWLVRLGKTDRRVGEQDRRAQDSYVFVNASNEQRKRASARRT